MLKRLCEAEKQHTATIVKHGGGSMMLWVRTGKLVRVDWRRDLANSKSHDAERSAWMFTGSEVGAMRLLYDFKGQRSHH